MICVIQIRDSDVTEWFMGQTMQEVCDKIQSSRWRNNSLHLDQLWQELCSRTFSTSGRYDTASGHVLLIE